MDKTSAVTEVNRRAGASPIGLRETHFANVNKTKPVWWLEIPLREVSNTATPVINLLLAGDKAVYHLRVPKNWIIQHIDEFAVRTDKGVIALELGYATAVPRSPSRISTPQLGAVPLVTTNGSAWHSPLVPFPRTFTESWPSDRLRRSEDPQQRTMIC